MLVCCCRLFLSVILALPVVVSAEPPDNSPTLPRLGVVIVVDQMRPDYLTRFDKLYTGGFKRLQDSGAVFLNAFHDHAATETAVGHTTISTGCYPSHHGIIGNDFYDRIEKRNVYSMLDTLSPVIGKKIGRGSSPRRILSPSLGEQLKAAFPDAKVYSVALKDRSAIGMGGKTADGVYWWNRAVGNFVTSIYYDSVYPQWIDAFNATRQIDSYFASGWTRLFPDSVYLLSDPDASPNENDGIHTTFPHRFTEFSAEPDTTYYDELYATPFADEVVLSLARKVIENGKLGLDSIPDLLWISCSAADAAGHTYGPNSQEMQDFYLRLDGYLGEFFAFLDSVIGKNQWVGVLSSDHGVLPLPELLRKEGIEARRLHPDSVKADMLAAGKEVQELYGMKTNPVLTTGSEVLLDTSLAEWTDLSIPELEQLVGMYFKKLPYVADVYTRYELAKDMPEFRPYWEQYWHNYYADRSPDLFVRFSENTLITSDTTGTSHGTPYAYDRTVPIVFAGPGVASGRYADKIRTIDIAPTLAALLRIPISSKMDGEIVKLALDH